MESVCLPELDQLLSDAPPTEPYPYTKTFDEAKHDPCFIVQTSDSSKIPKPVIWTHWSISTADQHHSVPPLDERSTLQPLNLGTRKRQYLGWPMLEGAGLSAGLLETCFKDTTIVIGPQSATAETLSDMIEYANIDTANCLSTDLENMTKKPEVLAKLARLKFITYLGGM
jgi:acyl-CoA synthetase (AMP-forming)/AMP-acid ligase II